ncbi:MAG: GNAT family N-acetyltransferase [Candidatus Daviesbacteria bacterium]|nr:GNAT family N-acetyltransferase [Candidatus Daviesbacteria bacterium]
MIIRKAHLEDLKTIQDLSKELIEYDSRWVPYFNLGWSHDKDGEKFFRKVLTGRNRICFIAIIDNKIVGYLAGAILPSLSWRKIKRLEITNIFIKEKFRNQNIGNRLVDIFFEWGRKKGIKRAVVVASSGNDKAIKFYIKKRFSSVFLTLESDI